MGDFPTIWYGGKGETQCGAGSMVKNMRSVIAEVPNIIKKRGISTVIEIGCGDLNFAKHAVLPTGVTYTGYDIQERASWRDFPGITLIEENALEVHEFRADMVICRDFFIHLPNTMISAILQRLHYQWLLATSYPGASNSRMEAPSAGFQAVDLAAPPFLLGEPLQKIQEHVLGKYLCLWRAA